MANAAYLFAAFSIIWIVVFGFIITMFVKQRKLNRELKNLMEMQKSKT